MLIRRSLTADPAAERAGSRVAGEGVVSWAYFITRRTGRYPANQAVMIPLRRGATLVAFLLMGTSPAGAAPKLPNVVLIVADDMGYGDLACNGAGGLATRNLNRLAREGRRFTNFHVAHSLCTPSRAALRTGCYANRIGMHAVLFPKATTGTSDAETTLPQLLRQKGYATGMVGKWHLGDHPGLLPTRGGFDEFFGIPYSHDMWQEPRTPKPEGFRPLPMIDGENVFNPDISANDQEHLTEWYTEHAVLFIKRQKGHPFFLYVAHSTPHVPLFVPEKFRGSSGKGTYGDAILEIDWSVGEVLRALEDTGVEQDTLVIFLSDNGPWIVYGDHAGSARPFREGKGTCWEGGLRVPCRMRWPGKFPAGTNGRRSLASSERSFPSTRSMDSTSGRSWPPSRGPRTRTTPTCSITRTTSSRS